MKADGVVERITLRTNYKNKSHHDFRDSQVTGLFWKWNIEFFFSNFELLFLLLLFIDCFKSQMTGLFWVYFFLIFDTVGGLS
jgi:hypothetical protein